MVENTTSPKSLWTQTVMEILVDFLNSGKSDDEIKLALNELKAKGFTSTEIITKVRNKSGEEQANRIKALLS